MQKGVCSPVWPIGLSASTRLTAVRSTPALAPRTSAARSLVSTTATAISTPAFWLRVRLIRAATPSGSLGALLAWVL